MFCLGMSEVTRVRQGLREIATRYRIPLLVASMALFVGGSVWSIGNLDLEPAAVSVAPILLVLIVLVPLGILVSAWNLQLLARTVETRISLAHSIAATAYGRIAEILPIPGAAMVRGAALLGSGANFGAMIGVLAWSSLMTLATAGLFAAIPVLLRFPLQGWVIMAGSACAFVASVAWVARRAGLGIVGGMIAVRFLTLILTTLRFAACFAAISAIVPPVDTLLFVVGSTLTTYIGIVPAGLGIGESISAALAVVVGVAPAAAFLAAAINRISGLVVSGVVALVMFAAGSYRPAALS